MISVIDYKRWDFTGRGKNILPFLTQQERAIWFAALPFQDKRNDPGQGEIVTYFSLFLLRLIYARRKIVIPSAILHDIGWGKIKNADEIHRNAIRDGIVDIIAYRMTHQTKGVEIAQEILLKLDFLTVQDRKLTYDIIGDHDTRI